MRYTLRRCAREQCTSQTTAQAAITITCKRQVTSSMSNNVRDLQRQQYIYIYIYIYITPMCIHPGRSPAGKLWSRRQRAVFIGMATGVGQSVDDRFAKHRPSYCLTRKLIGKSIRSVAVAVTVNWDVDEGWTTIDQRCLLARPELDTIMTLLRSQSREAWVESCR